MVDKDRVEGALRETGGRAERALGDLVGDTKTQSQGAVDQLAGAAQNAYGQAKEAVRSIAADAPDYVDQVLDVGERSYRQGSRAVSRTLGDEPLAGLVIGGALGYALAWLIHGRR